MAGGGRPCWPPFVQLEDRFLARNEWGRRGRSGAPQAGDRDAEYHGNLAEQHVCPLHCLPPSHVTGECRNDEVQGVCEGWLKAVTAAISVQKKT
jgi:hypothetical protein